MSSTEKISISEHISMFSKNLFSCCEYTIGDIGVVREMQKIWTNFGRILWKEFSSISFVNLCLYE